MDPNNNSGIDPTVAATAIANRSQFDHVHITGTHYQSRYGTIHEALVGRNGRRDDVAIRLLDCPSEPEAESEFADEITRPLRQWSSVSDHEHVVTVLDTGNQPSPWVMTATTAGCLADKQPMDFVDPLDVALQIADGVAYLHNREVVHAGLEPRSIVFAGDTFDDVVQGTPLIDSVGLMHVYRYYFEPATYLKPGYAAPEYFSRDFGRVDHLTDIYQLGSTLYRLFTGETPYTGSFERIREVVLNSAPPAPSTAGADTKLDSVITKAMAKEKMHRYETIEHLKQDLASIAANREYE